jgi:hypothetical protein
MTLAVVAVVLLFWNLTKIANNTRVPDSQGRSFWLEGQRVVQCSPDEITLVDKRGSQTHLLKDESWPDCFTFEKDAAIDFFLSRGEKTRFLKMQKSAWWH